MTKLRQTMIDAMLLRGFSLRTHESYLDAVEKLALYYHRSPDRITVDEIQAYFLYLAKERQLSAASCRLHLNGIRFFYVQVLQQAFNTPVVIPKRPQRIPELLTRQEVARIIKACQGKKYQTMLSVCYGCGLRVSELVALKVRDIDGERHLLRVEQGKGARDRQVILSETLLHWLRVYWKQFRPYLWLFCGAQLDQPISVSSVQKRFGEAKQRAQVKKYGGIHSLRHAYATHQLAAGLPVTQLQQQLGHQNIQSTLRYVHWIPDYRGTGQGCDLIAGLEVSHV